MLHLWQGQRAAVEHVAAVHVDGKSFLAGLLRGHHYSATATSRTIKRRGRGSLQHVDALYDVGVDVGKRQVSGNAVEHQQWGLATKTDRWGLHELRGIEYREAGNASRHRRCHVDTLYLVKLVARHFLRGVAKGLLRTFHAKGRHHEFRHVYHALFHREVDDLFAAYLHLLCLTANIRHHQRCVASDLQRVFAIDVGHRAFLRYRVIHRGSHYGLSPIVSYRACHQLGFLPNRCSVTSGASLWRRFGDGYRVVGNNLVGKAMRRQHLRQDRGDTGTRTLHGNIVTIVNVIALIGKAVSRLALNGIEKTCERGFGKVNAHCLC